MSDWNKAIERAARLIYEESWRHWVASHRENVRLSMTESDCHRIQSDQLDGLTKAIRALKVPYPFCCRPEHCAGKGYCDRDPASND